MKCHECFKNRLNNQQHGTDDCKECCGSQYHTKILPQCSAPQKRSDAIDSEDYFNDYTARQ